MKSLLRFIVLVLFLAGWGLAAGALHVVLTPEKVVLVGKDRFSLIEDTYADTRNWTLNDVYSHPELTRRLIEAGKAGALAHVVGTTEEAKIIFELQETLDHGPPATQPAETAPAAPATRTTRPPVNPRPDRGT